MPAFNENDSAENIFKNVFSSGINTLCDTLKMIDYKKAEKRKYSKYNLRDKYSHTSLAL